MLSRIPSAVRHRRHVLLALPALALAACAPDPVGVDARRPARSVAAAEEYVPGQTYFGDDGYVEYLAGDLPVIFSAPHGGDLTPGTIPVRTAGAACGPEVTTVLDANTQDLARRVREAFFNRTGRYPHVVINRLHRNRLDANREIGEAACGDAAAEEAWRDYHAFLDAAKAAVLAQHGRGWYTDLHGHGHAIPRLELGYELGGATLRRADAELDAGETFERNSSIRAFSEGSPLSFSALLRGPSALGTLFADAGYPSVPSAQDPAPDVGEDYFNGGYNTDRHACSRGGGICGVQIEANNAGVRNTARNRSAFAAAIVGVYAEYLAPLGVAIPVPPAPGIGEPLVIDDDNLRNDGARARFLAATAWSTGTNSQAVHGEFALRSSVSGADDAEFLFRVATPGTYAVDAWWPSQSGRSTGAAFLVFAPDAAEPAATVVRSQRVDGRQWNPLGTWRFDTPGWARVVLSQSLSTADGSLAADAVRVTQVNAAPRATIATADATLLQGERYESAGTIVDPGSDAWTATVDYGDGTGSAPLAVAGGGFALDHRYARAGTFTVTVRVSDGELAGSATARVVVRTPAEGLAALDAAVRALVDAGTVSDGNGRSLLAKLEAAAAQLARGNANPVRGQLGAFVNEVEAMARSGRLPAADAASLAALAERIVASLGA